MERWLSASKKSHKRGKKLKEIHHNITIKLWLVIKVNWDTAYLSLGIVAVDKESLILQCWDKTPSASPKGFFNPSPPRRFLSALIN